MCNAFLEGAKRSFKGRYDCAFWKRWAALLGSCVSGLWRISWKHCPKDPFIPPLFLMSKNQTKPKPKSERRTLWESPPHPFTDHTQARSLCSSVPAGSYPFCSSVVAHCFHRKGTSAPFPSFKTKQFLSRHRWGEHCLSRKFRSPRKKR